MTRTSGSLASFLLLLAGCRNAEPVIQPAVQTEAVQGNPDDPAIWIHPNEPNLSRILGTTKLAAPDGALVVFDLDGKIRQTFSGIDRPNNVAVAYGLNLGGKLTDIAITTARNSGTAWIFAIDPASGTLRDISAGGIPVFETEPAARRRPMGIAIYTRPRDHAMFAIFSRKTGPSSGYLWQYRITGNDKGGAQLSKVREFGNFSGQGEIEAIAVDDELGFVYYSDEGSGIRKWAADPDDPNANRELGVFAKEGFSGDREGLAVFAAENGQGYLVATDQLAAGSRFYFYSRTGDNQKQRTLVTSAESTDGIDITSRPLGPRFPRGLMVVMNNRGNNFFYYRWEDVERFAK